MGYSLPGSSTGAASDLFSGLLYPETAIIGAGPLVLGHMHVCSGASYAVSLPAPAGNAGKLVGVRMAQGLTGLVTLDAGAGVAIDGQQTRILWAGEDALLLCDGSNWAKVAGKSLPMRGTLAPSADQTFAANTFTQLMYDTAIRTKAPTGFVDATNKRFVALRPGAYSVMASLYTSTGNASATLVTLDIVKNGSVMLQAAAYAQAASNAGFSVSYPGELVVGDLLTIGGAYFSGAYASSIYSNDYANHVYNQFAATEVPTW